ncbi:MAG: hypothetical protein JWP27_1606 [Flaviaesturariibacter sp.]|nr:hypothetical protein [Flaviaesturariibacter sp.]
MHPLYFFHPSLLSADERSLLCGIAVSLLFYVNYRRLQAQIDRQEMLDSFLES